MTPYASGFNTNKALIDYLVEGKEKFVGSLDNKVAAWIGFALPEGKISKIAGVEELSKIPGVFKIDLDDIYIGKKTKKLDSDAEKCGPILIKAASENECYQIMECVKATLKITVQTAHGTESQIW